MLLHCVDPVLIFRDGNELGRLPIGDFVQAAHYR